MRQATDTIVAIATAAGPGGIGILRLSGVEVLPIAFALGIAVLRPRHAHYAYFRDAQGDTIDDGIALWFPAPHSFTGEDVLELQAHGSPVLLRDLLARVIELGARQARAGEFSERAFLNGKLDLVQAEAVADLIAAADLRAARAARRTLDGLFSRRIEALMQTLTHLRIHAEAAIDFSDESLETLGVTQMRAELAQARTQLTQLIRQAECGRKLRDGLHAVLVGPPNVGKSSLLNALAGFERAIVTDVAGTTRDTLCETIRCNGFELTLVDTAGLRDGGDAIEREGMRRTRIELQRADAALIVLDARDPNAAHAAIADAIATVPHHLWIYNKCDLLTQPAVVGCQAVTVSAITGEGMDILHARLRGLAEGDAVESVEGEFSARVRHTEALRCVDVHVSGAEMQLQHNQFELVAEELRLAQDALGEITGKLGADDLLGRIFSDFCIGK